MALEVPEHSELVCLVIALEQARKQGKLGDVLATFQSNVPCIDRIVAHYRTLVLQSPEHFRIRDANFSRILEIVEHTLRAPRRLFRVLKVIPHESELQGTAGSTTSEAILEGLDPLFARFQLKAPKAQYLCEQTKCWLALEGRFPQIWARMRSLAAQAASTHSLCQCESSTKRIPFT